MPLLFDVGNNNLSVSDTNGNLNLEGNGTGTVILENISWPNADGFVGQTLTTDGS